MITVSNPEAIAAKHGHPSGITTKGGKLTGWPDHIPYPTQADIDLWESEYVAPADPDDELDAAILASNNLGDLKAALMGRARGRGRK